MDDMADRIMGLLARVPLVIVCATLGFAPVCAYASQDTDAPTDVPTMLTWHAVDQESTDGEQGDEASTEQGAQGGESASETGDGNVATLSQSPEVTNGWLSYYIEGGNPVTGQKKIDGDWYYFDPSAGGTMACGFVELPVKGGTTKTVYYDELGRMAHGFVTVEGKGYYFDPSTGAMATGQVKIGDYWYFFDPNTGVMAQSAFVTHESQGKTVYYDEQGRMVKGELTIDGKTYTFDQATGALVSQ